MVKQQELYEKLKADGFSDLPDYNTFQSALQDKGKREQLHAALLRHYSDIPDFERFDKALGSRDMTFGENVRHIGKKIGNTMQAAGRAFAEGGDRTAEGLFGAVGTVLPGEDPFERMAEASKTERAAQATLPNGGQTYRPVNTFEGAGQKIMSGDVLGGIGEGIGATIETGAGSLAGMATTATPVVGVAAFGVSQMQQFAEERAKNSGRDKPGAMDYVVAAPAAAISAALERIGIGGLNAAPMRKYVTDSLQRRLGVNAVNTLAKAAIEGGTEAQQQIVQYTAEILGTQKDFDLGEAGRQALVAAAGGAGVGGMIGGSMSVMQKPETVRTDAGGQEIAQVIDQQVNQADLQTQERLMGIGQPQPQVRPAPVPRESMAEKLAKRGVVLRQFDQAVIQQESSGNPNAVNELSGATGQYQIMPIFLKEGNRLLGSNYSMQDMKNPAKAEQVKNAVHGLWVRQFQRRNGRLPDAAEMAMMHHGGPEGYLRPNAKDAHGISNAEYARKVVARMGQPGGMPQSSPVELPAAPELPGMDMVGDQLPGMDMVQGVPQESQKPAQEAITAVEPTAQPKPESNRAEAGFVEPQQATNEQATIQEQAQEAKPAEAAQSGLPTQPQGAIRAEVASPVATESLTAQKERVPDAGEPIEKKEPWQMTRSEFNASHLFRGVTDETANNPNTFWGDEGIARSFANARGRNNPRVRIARKQDVPKDALWDDDTPTTVDKELEKRGEFGISAASGLFIPVSYEIPIGGVNNPHEFLVKSAIAEGKPVPPEVLAEYPELKKKAPATEPAVPAKMTKTESLSRAQAAKREKALSSLSKNGEGSATQDQPPTKQQEPGSKPEPTTVSGKIERQLEDAGKYTEEQRKAAGVFVQSFYNAKGKQLGVSPESLYKVHPYQIEGGDAQGEVLEQKTSKPKKLYRGVAYGIQENGDAGRGIGSLGKGLYSSPSKAFAKKFGTVEELSPDKAFPDNPLVLRVPPGSSAQSAFSDWIIRDQGFKNIREFGRKYSDPGEYVRSLGYDGVVAGDEIVKYSENVLEQKTGRLPATIEIDGKQRPTTNSEGRQIHPTEEGVRNFWKWFGDSKVVDEQGRPLVVYHGTMSGDIEEFIPQGGGDKATGEKALKLYREAKKNNGVFGYANFRSGMFFSPHPEYAGNYTRENQGSIYPVYISAINPIYVDQVTREVTGTDANKTPDALILKDGKTINEIAVIESVQIKSATGNSGTFSPDDASILRQRKAPERRLLIQHNLSIGNLIHSDKMGGIAVPSLAITDKDASMSSFGEITLLGDENTASPSKDTKVFGADIYSPRYPEVTNVYDKKKAESFLRKLHEWGKKTGDRNFYIDDLERASGAPDKLEYSTAYQAMFLDSKGIKPVVVMTSENVKDVKRLRKSGFGKWIGQNDWQAMMQDKEFLATAKRMYERDGFSDLLETENASRNLIRGTAQDIARLAKEGEKEKVDGYETATAINQQINDNGLRGELQEAAREEIESMVSAEKIFAGFTYSGNRRYHKHDLETVVKLLKKELRGGENFNYGGGSVRAMFTPQFKSIKAIRDNKTRLISKEQFDAIKTEIDEEIIKIGDELKPSHSASSSFGYYDAVTMMMADSAKMGLRRALVENGFEVDAISEKSMKDVSDFLNKLRTLPTEYFEVKVLRAMQIGEFSAAVVPDNTPEKAIAILKKNGVTDIRKYKSGDNTDRAAKINELDHLFFQKGEGETLAGFDPERLTTILTEKATFASFLHETGHAYLDMTAAIASQKGAPKQIKFDMDILLKWFGVKDLAEWNAMNLNQKRKYHEQFAYNFEVYLSEGKAPSVGLKGVFDRFKQWLKDVYRDIKTQVNAAYRAETGEDLPGLTDEVRGVMDRLLADKPYRKPKESKTVKSDDAKSEESYSETFAEDAKLGKPGASTYAGEGELKKKTFKEHAGLKGREIVIEKESGERPRYKTPYYEVIPNAQTVEEAVELSIDRTIDEIEAAIRDRSVLIAPHVRVALAELTLKRLSEQYRKTKDAGILERQNDLADFITDYAEETGRTLQAFSLYKSLTPEGVLVAYNRVKRKAEKAHYEKNQPDVDDVIGAVGKGDKEQKSRKLKDLLRQRNRVARKIRPLFERIVEASELGVFGKQEFYDIVGPKLGLPEYSEDVARRLMELTEAVQLAPEGIPQEKAIAELHRFIAKHVGFGVQDLPLGIYYGNILSGYMTHTVNIADTFANVVSEVNNLAISNPKAAAFVYAQFIRGFNEGRYDAVLAWSEGRRLSDGKWYEGARFMDIAEFGKKGGVPIIKKSALSRYVKVLAESKAATPLNMWKYVTRLLTAEDALMWRPAHEARAALLAFKLAEEQGLKGSALIDRASSILNLRDITPYVDQAKREGFAGQEAMARAVELRDMLRPAILNEDAKEWAGDATYNHTPRGLLGLVAKQTQILTNKIPPLKFLVPFTQIVANVTNRGLNWTPYGFKRAYYGHFFGDPLNAEQRQAMLVRATVGTSALVGVAALNALGAIVLHGHGPEDDKERYQMMNGGWIPYSVEIDGKYISYANTPIGLGLAVLGNAIDMQRYGTGDDESTGNRLAMAVLMIGNTVFSQSFLSGLSGFFEALTSDNPGQAMAAWKSLVSRTVSGLSTPNALRDTYRFFDPKAYRASSFMEAIVKNTPFAASAGLKPALNALGQPIYPLGAGATAAQRNRFFGVKSGDPVWRYVMDSGIRISVPSATTEIDLQNDIRMTPDQYYEYHKEQGQDLYRYIEQNLSRLKEMEKEDAEEVVNNYGKRNRKRILSRMRREFQQIEAALK
ncbi:MAG: transglycosylase SLT domain-containing protein [Desulfobulbaceae bacterium]|nr:transglycosylase SLT domain-containing protein [Desulfobulbaceae bacterium]